MTEGQKRQRNADPIPADLGGRSPAMNWLALLVTFGAVAAIGGAFALLKWAEKKIGEPKLGDPYPPEAAEAPDREQVIAHVTFRVLGDGGRVPANLRYRRDDPYAVTVVFAGTNPWAFARELLHTVAVDRMPTGLGDVCWYERDATTLVLAIGSPDGRSVLTIAHADVAAFLRDTYTVVPRGEEADHLGLDAELALLLATEEAL